MANKKAEKDELTARTEAAYQESTGVPATPRVHEQIVALVDEYVDDSGQGEGE